VRGLDRTQRAYALSLRSWTSSDESLLISISSGEETGGSGLPVSEADSYSPSVSPEAIAKCLSSEWFWVVRLCTGSIATGVEQVHTMAAANEGICM
jgi:hypothetical protein